MADDNIVLEHLRHIEEPSMAARDMREVKGRLAF